MADRTDLLFPELHAARYGNNRRTRPLFLPRLLEAASRDNRIIESLEYKRAYEIICKWADLETRCKIKKAV